MRSLTACNRSVAAAFTSRSLLNGWIIGAVSAVMRDVLAPFAGPPHPSPLPAPFPRLVVRVAGMANPLEREKPPLRFGRNGGV